MKSVSVAMATYNGALYLRGQLESIASQLRLPAELIVTDDGSTDDTLLILAEFSRTAPFPVRVHENAQRLGYRANFMRAASLCGSDIIAFCDQDDVWSTDKLQRCAGALESTGALMVCHNATVTDSDLNPIDTLARDALPRPYNPPLSIDPMRHSLGFTLVFDRRLLQFSALWDRSIDLNDEYNREGHDQWFFFLANVFGALVYVDATLAQYRRHASTATLTSWAGASQASQAIHFLFECLPRWENHALAFERRAAILDEIAKWPSSPHEGAARTGAEKYRALARLYRERVELYNGATIVRRFRQFMRIFASGGYRTGDVWAKGRKSALKDLLAGVLRLSHIMPSATRTRLRGY
ncbi:putative Alpha-L-Rha alpha-1,3-L-rhamnosyltransferase [Paraburkholderia piptadeniae]|uniref:Alpha-L-Rha alpha-1,3-L-rhamnosyltransferase n=1 Tax=Paraburkholderia piptadeniae TaxID=1701573 RepID=A0A1N7RN81_9BURK|nr:glycosyltransferase [Paraburkholderia piptadeniae]SIT36574.1 putative Alpha-L-Rha alpha-1,3-L-rhamnosyltransferase [Paraburkholderia piptadeniae]